MQQHRSWQSWSMICMTHILKLKRQSHQNIHPIGAYSQIHGTSFVQNQSGLPFRVAVARQLTTIGQRTILENRREIQLLQDNDDQQKNELHGGLKREVKKANKEFFRVFCWVTLNQRPCNLGAVARVWDYPQLPYLRDSRVSDYPKLPYLRDSRVSSLPRTVRANWGAHTRGCLSPESEAVS